MIIKKVNKKEDILYAKCLHALDNQFEDFHHRFGAILAIEREIQFYTKIKFYRQN